MVVRRSQQQPRENIRIPLCLALPLTHAAQTKVNLFHPAKMGLTNIQRLHEALGRPTDGLPAVHIAGTNGKVSVLEPSKRDMVYDYPVIHAPSVD